MSCKEKFIYFPHLLSLCLLFIFLVLLRSVGPLMYCRIEMVKVDKLVFFLILGEMCSILSIMLAIDFFFLRCLFQSWPSPLYPDFIDTTMEVNSDLLFIHCCTIFFYLGSISFFLLVFIFSSASIMLRW